MSRPRGLLVLTGILAASLTAGLGAWKRWHTVWHPPPVESLPAQPRGDVSTQVGDLPAPSPSDRPAVFSPPDPKASTQGFRGGREHRHRSPFTGPTAAPHAELDFDAGAPLEAMPAITPDGDLIVATLGGKVVRLTPSGKPVWTYDLRERAYASPLISGDVVIVGSDAKKVVALTLATGKPRWQVDVDGEADTAPAEGPGGVVVFAAGRVLYEVKLDGTIRFRLKLPRKIYSSPAIADDGTILVGAQDKKLYAVSPEGAVRWSKDLGGDVDCAPSIGDAGRIYAASDAGEVVALDLQGKERWRSRVGGFIRGGLTVGRGGLVFAGTYGPAPRIVALDGATGRERWSFSIQGTGAPEYGIHGAPLEDGSGNLYFGAHDDAVYGLDGEGRLRFRFMTHGDVDAPLVLGASGVLYAASDDGHLYGLR